MDHQFGGGSWMMIPTQNPLSHDFHSLQPQFSSQQQPPPPPLQQQQHPSLASHFHLLPLVERLSEAIDIGNRDQHYEDLIMKYRSHVEDLVKPENSR
ncbi:hypothetical protein ZIOFF_072317 [Zingiber officinale]|uniref:Uncharacterized protein n=1 Tax=Zingiber officinale TaxID=94328 RepID=A0A8J5CVB5_ZINOF|nr:hypothetical protein ZIOFF_072317 [Zingiber officinale]